MKGRLGIVLFATGAITFFVGFVVVEAYIGRFVMPVGIVFLVIGYLLWTREARRSPWPRPPPMPPTIEDRIAEGRGRTPAPVSRDRLTRGRKVVSVFLAALLVLAGLAVVASRSSGLILVSMVAVLTVSFIRLIYEKGRYRRGV